MSTDLLERLNNELTRALTVRAPGMHLAYIGREHFLEQLHTVHRHTGGRAIQSGRPMPANIENGQLLTTPGIPFRTTCQITDSGPPSDASQPAPAAPAEHLDALVIVALGPENGAVVARLPNPTFFNRFKHHQVATLAAVAAPGGYAPGGEAPDGGGDCDVVCGVGQKTGYNPYFLARNKYAASVRESAGGRIRKEEYDRLMDAFKKDYNSGRHDAEISLDETREWQQSPAVRNTSDNEVADYVTSWGGGTHDAPISTEELFEEWRLHGWPSDADISDPTGTFRSVAADYTVDYSTATDYQLWSIGRQANNIDRDTLLHPQQFRYMELGMLNAIARADKEVVENGQLIYMMEGARRAVAVNEPNQSRLVFCLTGVSWLPYVF